MLFGVCSIHDPVRAHLGASSKCNSRCNDEEPASGGLGLLFRETFRGTFSEPRCLKEVRREPHLAVLETFLRRGQREAQTERGESPSGDDLSG